MDRQEEARGEVRAGWEIHMDKQLESSQVFLLPAAKSWTAIADFAVKPTAW